MSPWLALQVEWVRAGGLSDHEFIAAAELIGKGDDARNQVEIYHTEYEGRRH